MANKSFDQMYALNGYSSVSISLIENMYNDCLRMGIADTLIAIGAQDRNRATMRHMPKNLTFGLTEKDAKTGSGFQASPDRANRQKHIWHPQDIAINDQVIQRMSESEIITPTTIWVYSPVGGQITPMLEQLKDRRARVDEIALGVANIAHEDYLRIRYDQALKLMLELKQKRYVESSILFDNLSLIVKRFGRPYQDELISSAVVACLASIVHFRNMKGPADVFTAMGHYSPLLGLSFGLKHLVVAKEVNWYKPISKVFGFEPKGTVALQHLITQTIAAIEDAVHDPAWRSIDDPPDMDQQTFMMMSVPMKLNDSRWQQVSATVENYMVNKYEKCTILWVSANGLKNPELGNISPYWVQASLLYGLPIPPQAIQEQIDLKSPPAGSNGKVAQKGVEQLSH